eukprot:CAMPEP_0184746192 /NCGR_PEP_ID=MMETSP0315-20130426/8730_1 /TAXON_ID=101924 /ORGANISM="Rhodosorus marinus, Strain UTEX LB 2760" /LENGTH=157 /DNA_ID=CAMNT_0027218617 /DNA_START=627 /DNA_END=1100 /DNA_ORIENTATION=+
MNVQDVGILDPLYLAHVRGEPFTESCGSDLVPVHIDISISLYLLQTLLPYSFDYTFGQAASSADVHNPIDIIILSSIKENHIPSLRMTKDAFRSVSSPLNPLYNTPQILHLLRIVSILKLAAAISVPREVEGNSRQGKTLRNSSQRSRLPGRSEAMT